MCVKLILLLFILLSHKNNFSRSCYADLHITAELIKGNAEEMNEFLYPHDKACFRIVVPRIKTEQDFFDKLSQNNVAQSICLSVLLIYISKIILNRSWRVHDWILTFFTIISSIFGQKRQKISTPLWETIWNAQLLLITIFSTAALSAISYQSLVSVKYNTQIDTINDLIESDLRIFVEISKKSDFNIWGSSLE